MNIFPTIHSVESVVSLPRFQTKEGKSAIAMKHIVFLSAMSNYTLFHLASGEQVVTSLSLSVYEPLLENLGFMRIHKSTIFNLYFLDRCTFRRAHTLTLPTGQTIDIARRRRTAIKKIIQEYNEVAQRGRRTRIRRKVIIGDTPQKDTNKFSTKSNIVR